MSELSKAYLPGDVESAWYDRWVRSGAFHADELSERPAYSIVIPPPNVTGVLHIGHVLNNTIQDILARRARQNGYEVLWLPGTDHAGIATQTMVEKQMRKEEGKSRRDVGREAFLQRVWEWKNKHGGIIIKQLKRLGCSCDWERERFTMDEDYSVEVSRVFASLFKQGLIRRGKRMVNWCPASQTALSDEEVIPTVQRGKLYTMQYEVVERPGVFLQISTTRPETIMGDTAVAVHPKDPRHQDLIGLHVRRPFPAADIPIIGDEAVDMEFGSGSLKVTPAHDRVDFDIGLRHSLPIIDVLFADGSINCPETPEFHGKDRFEVRKLAAAKLEEMGLLLSAEDYENTVGFSERAGVSIEPRLSMQWFLRCPQALETAYAVASSSIRFRPEHWRKSFAHWMDRLQDWCVSRQLWWGHQIPVWYRADRVAEIRERENLDESDRERGDIFVGDTPPADGEWVRDDDVLDTWFSSWLWPFATMDDATRAKFYPTTDLVTGPDIIFFWVARMIMAGLEFKKEIPFRNVYFTSLIRDKHGRKMSKTLGNSPDALELMGKYGADGLRFGLMRSAPVGQDIKFDEKQIEEGRNFANKLWNACRFRLMQEPPAVPAGPRSRFDEHILLCLANLEVIVAKSLAEYQFNTATQALYDFFWGDYCDWYLEAAKLRFYAEDQAARAAALETVDTVLRRFLPQLHAFMPHITEELWEQLGFSDGGLLMLREFEKPMPEYLTFEKSRRIVEEIYASVRAVRNVKAEGNVASRKVVVFLIPHTDITLNEMELAVFGQLVGASKIVIGNETLAGAAARAITPLGEVAIPLEGLIDPAAEVARLEKEIIKVVKERDGLESRLANEGFVAQAPPEVILENRERSATLTAKAKRLRLLVAALSE